MKIFHALSLLSIAFILNGCHSKKQSAASAPPVATSPAATPPATSAPIPSSSGSAGITMKVDREFSYYAPGEEEVNVIQRLFPGASLQQLQEGHTLYTKGACIGCHGPEDIYKYNQENWPRIVDDMAYRAKLTPPEKEAVLRYVLAIKANQNAGK